ncbi:tRNA 2'-phosphotransferase 1 [Eublepharis macularius]|uniref:2'-phosphotransferase n=1 Tax=Eublepharis macularius TaxID=481883 RepID=A0AA97IXC0_EUBMA|nr:tRNA 2'-phosphotransferase 1 [Eublepharis macularius]
MEAEGSSIGQPPQNPARRARNQANRRRRRDQDADVRLSKALSYALRHGADKLGLHMGPDGFVDVAEVLCLPQFKAWSPGDVQRVVETNDKQRFAMRLHPSDGHPQIRANQGHSLQVSELELVPLLDPADFPDTVAHGTYLRHWPAIRRTGLSRMGRTHIHLAPGLPGDGAILSGMRNSCEVAIIIDAAKALADGIPFYHSANGVILTPGNADGLLVPRYFQEALQLRPVRCRLSLE